VTSFVRAGTLNARKTHDLKTPTNGKREMVTHLSNFQTRVFLIFWCFFVRKSLRFL